MRNAVMNASSSRPAPKKTAKICSRTTPSTRLASTAMLTTLARRARTARPPASAGGNAAATGAVGSEIIAFRGTRCVLDAQTIAGQRRRAGVPSRSATGMSAAASSSISVAIAAGPRVPTM